MSDQPNHISQNNSKIGKATRLIPPLIVGGIAVVIMMIIFAILNPRWQFVASAVVGAALIAVMAAGNARIKRGMTDFGIQTVLYSVILVVFLNGVWFEGLGFTLSIGLVMIVFEMTSLTLNNRQSYYIIGASVFASLALIALDNFDLPFRLFFEPLTDILPVVVIVLILVFAYQIYRNFNQFGIQGKLVISTILFAVFSVAIVGRGLSDITRTILLPSAGQEISEQAEASGLSVGELLFRQTDTLQAFSLNAEIVSKMYLSSFQFIGDEEVFVENIKQIDSEWQSLPDTDRVVLDVVQNNLVRGLTVFQEQFPEFEIVYVIDQLGQVVAATERPYKYYFGEEDWWQSSINNQDRTVYIELLDNEAEALVGVGIASPIYNLQADEPIGVLYGVTSFNSYGDVLGSLAFGQTGTVELIFPGDKELGFEEDGSYELQENEEDEEDIFESVLNNEDEFFQSEFEGKDVVIAVAPVQTLSHEPVIDELGWQIVAFQNSDEVFELLDLQQNLAVLLGAVVIVLSGLGAIVFARRLADPIVALKETAVLVREGDLSARSNINTKDEVGELASTFNEMTSQLQETLLNLETRVAERTRIIETTARVSQNLSTILDMEQLVQEVVTQIQSAFNYYYVQIYLWDDFRSNLVLAGGSGDIGAQLVARGHSLTSGTGLVGRAAETGLPVLIPDVAEEVGWLPNELLPLTKAETAVPILYGQQVIGVLDVQHSITNGLDQQDVELIQSVANQFSVAYQNARNYSQQQKQAEFETQINDIRFRIQETQKVDDALKVTIRELAQVLGASKATVKMNTNKTNNGHDRNDTNKTGENLS